jgi:hypothetical protein
MLMSILISYKNDLLVKDSLNYKHKMLEIVVLSRIVLIEIEIPTEAKLLFYNIENT